LYCATVTVLTFPLSDHLPLLFAAISPKSGAIQASLLYDRIKCPKHFSDGESLMPTVTCWLQKGPTYYEAWPLSTTLLSSAWSAMTNHSVPFLGSGCMKMGICLQAFIPSFFSLSVSTH